MLSGSILKHGYNMGSGCSEELKGSLVTRGCSRCWSEMAPVIVQVHACTFVYGLGCEIWRRWFVLGFELEGDGGFSRSQVEA